jgi:nucleotide-binding universal stress UspA family protein
MKPYTRRMLAFAPSTIEIFLIFLAAWLAIGMTLAVVMGRRGHGAFQWLLLGAVLGPLALPLAWMAIRDEARASPRPLGESVSGGGSVDVLVGIDGSAEAANALQATIELVGANVGRLTLASVVTFDESPQARSDEQRAVELLEAAASSIEAHVPGRVLLAGQPAEALIRHATEDGYGLLAIGRRGRGASKAFLGSTAARVANGPVPVLIV